MRLKKLIAVDLIPTERRAVERWGFRYFPLREFIDLCANDDVDVIETLVTLQKRVPEDDTAESIAQVSQQFENKRYALEMSGGKVIECPAKRSANSQSGFKQSDDQRLMIKTLTLAMKLKPDILTLVAADSDYAPMVEALRDEGIRTEVIAAPEMLANDLRRHAVRVIDINIYLEKIYESRGAAALLSDNNRPMELGKNKIFSSSSEWGE